MLLSSPADTTEGGKRASRMAESDAAAENKPECSTDSGVAEEDEATAAPPPPSPLPLPLCPWEDEAGGVGDNDDEDAFNGRLAAEGSTCRG
jgi:hypothetical protein